MASTGDKISTVHKDKDFTLFTHGKGPNGWRVAHLLAELGLEFENVFLNFATGEQKSPEFLKLNPNGRIPALVDHKRNDFVVWESGAICLYLVKHYDPNYTLWSKDDDEQTLIIQWLFFQMSGYGPYIGQSFHFSLLRPDKLSGPIERYNDEVKRVLGVLELHLSKPESKRYLVGGRYTIADLSFIAWLNITEKLPIKLADYPAVHKWFTEMRNRPGTHKGYVGGPYERK